METVWKAAVPGKIKVFAWKACRNILPYYANLKKKRRVHVRSCVVCREEEESVMHSFWKCKHAQEVWQCHHAVKESDFLRQPDFISQLMVMMEKQLNLDLDCFLVVAWKICSQRNVLNNKGAWLPTELYRSAMKYLNEWKQRSVRHTKIRRNEMVRWNPPHEGCYKVNFDGTIFERKQEAGVGVVVRNKWGVVMAAMSRKELCRMIYR